MSYLTTRRASLREDVVTPLVPVSILIYKCTSYITGAEPPAIHQTGSPLMHAYGVTNIECRAATAATTVAACAWQRFSQQIYPGFPNTKALYLPTRRPTVPRLTVSRASIPNNGSGYPRQTLRSDRDGTLGPQSRPPADDMVALSSSAPRPPPTPSVLRSYDVPLWGRSSCSLTYMSS